MVKTRIVSPRKLQLPLALLLFSLLPGVIGIQLPVEDSFHFGESFAAAVTWAAAPGRAPITLHGGWDFIPALAMRWISGDEQYLYPTLFLIKNLLPAVSALLYLGLLVRLLNNRTGPSVTILLSMAALAVPSLVGIRDLFLLVTCWSLYAFLHPGDAPDRCRTITVLVASAAVGLIWSFDRGLIASAMVLAGLLTAFTVERRWLYGIVAVLIVAADAVVIRLAEMSGVLSYYSNIAFLMQTSSQWRYAPSLWVAGNTVLLVTFVVCTLLATLQPRSAQVVGSPTPFWVAMAVCSILMLRVGTNRPDLHHILWSMWPPVLLSACAFRQQSKPQSEARGLSILIAILTAAATFFFFTTTERPFTPLLIVAATALFWSASVRGEFRTRSPQMILVLLLFGFTLVGPAQNWLTTAQDLSRGIITTPFAILKGPVPFTRIADPGNAWAAQMIRKSKSECILDMTNSGIINAGVDKPTCTRFSYPVYATTDHESAFLSDLRAAAPRAIVYSSTNWQYGIDGRTMPMRLPRVDAVLRRTYPHELCRQDYCIRSLEPLEP